MTSSSTPSRLQLPVFVAAAAALLWYASGWATGGFSPVDTLFAALLLGTLYWLLRRLNRFDAHLSQVRQVLADSVAGNFESRITQIDLIIQLFAGDANAFACRAWLIPYTARLSLAPAQAGKPVPPNFIAIIY